MREWVVAARDLRCTRSRLWRATGRRAASRRVPSPRTVGCQAGVFVNALRPSREEIQLHVVSVGVERRLTPKLLDEIREFTEEDHWRISVKIVSYGITLSRTRSPKDIRGLRPSVIRTVLHLEDRHILDQSRRLDSDVICFSDETSPELTLWLQVYGFAHSLGKRAQRDNSTSLCGIYCAKTEEAHCYVGPIFLSHFS